MQLFPALPELQAVWERQGYTALVLEDRSGWRSLMETWNDSDPDPLEVVHWFYEMTELWDALGPWGGQSSLLVPENLRIDDDQILCLQRIHYDGTDQSLNLADLGQCWQHLLSPHRDTATCGALLTLAEAIVEGKLPDLGQVQVHLAELAEALQDDDDAPESAVPGAPAWSTEDGENDGENDGEVLPPLGPTAIDDPDQDNPENSLADDPGEDPDLDTLDTFDQAPPNAIGNAINAAPESEVFAGDMISDEDLMANFDDDSLDDSLHEDVTAGDHDSAIGDLPTMALPMQLFRLDEVGHTHVGRQRDHNEDTFFSRTHVTRIDGPKGPKLEAKGLYILCDGMGGHAGGEVASALAVETLAQYFAEHWQAQLPDVATIQGAIAAANQVIFERNDGEGRSGSGRMGTTLVVVLLQDTEAVVAHVGDSRLYGFTRRQGLQQLTVDHEVGQREIQRGVEPAIAYARPDAYQLTQALGPRSSEEVVPSIKTMPIMEDILLLLCSDGLSDNDLLEHHVTTHVEPLLKSRADLDEGVSQLIDLANEHNGHDNITALAIRLKLRPNMDALQG
jgi:protein phosphatase